MEPVEIRHNFSAAQNASELTFEAEVLTLLLEKTKAKYGPYKLIGVTDISQGRAFRELDKQRIDVLSTMTDTTRETQGIPIRYCLYKGLLGVRIGMGKLETVQKHEGLKSMADLKAVQVGQVFDWPDYAIQKEGGLNVARLTDFSSGLAQINAGQIALLPLGVTEVAPIAKAKGLGVISNWAIAYPTAYYFFVSKANPALAERLNAGFEIAIQDRSFDKLFAQKIEPLVATANLNQRVIFKLPNSMLPKETPLTRDVLWHPMVFRLFQNAQSIQSAHNAQASL